ncbi:2531_t:CDS:2, partial [Paraglomus occultum]
IESLLDHLFGKFDKGRPANLLQARNLWYTLRSLPAPKYSDNFSYNEDEWKKIQCWVEQAVGQFLDAFESSRNPLQQSGCHEHEWFHGYVIPIFQKALALDSTCYVPWGEVSVLASQRRRNHNKDVCIEKVERAHMADMLCSYEQYELVCGLSCGGPHFYDLTKLSSDEFGLPRMMKDMLDDIRLKFHCASKDESQLYVLGLQTYMTEIRIYLMDRCEVYRLHFVKTITLPLTFPAYRNLNLRTALKWAWNVRGIVKELIKEIEKDSDDDDDRVKTPLYEPLIMPTQDTPKKVPKKRVTKK